MKKNSETVHQKPLRPNKPSQFIKKPPKRTINMNMLQQKLSSRSENRTPRSNSKRDLTINIKDEGFCTCNNSFSGARNICNQCK